MLRAPLKDLAGGNSSLDVDGATVGEVLLALERTWPKIEGWILDERGHVRAHVNVFVNGERTAEDTPVAAADVLQVLPSISGGGAGGSIGPKGQA